MPIRFSTEAANADFLGEEPDSAGTADGTPQAARTGRAAERTFTRGAQSSEITPGTNSGAGFVRDKDTVKP